MYGMGWDTQTQIVNRRGWLQSAGMLTDMGDGKVKLSEKGQLLLSEISLHDPTSGPAVIKVVEVTTTEDSVELSPLPDSLIIGAA